MSQRTPKRSISERVFFTAAVQWMSGMPVPLKISGNKHEVSVVQNVLESSKNFVLELHRDGATVDTVTEALERKKRDAAEFESTFGFAWLL